MKRHFGTLALFALIPLPAFAFTSVQGALIDVLVLINRVIIPFLFAIATLFIIWNLTRFLIFKGATEEGQDKGKRLIIYGIAALVLMMALWGVVKITLQVFGVTRTDVPCPDFVPGCFRGYGGTGGFNEDGTMRVFDILDPGAGIQNRPPSLY